MLSKPLLSNTGEQFFDEDTGVLYLGAKGDTSVRFYEIVKDAPYVLFLLGNRFLIGTVTSTHWARTQAPHLRWALLHFLSVSLT